MQALTQDKPSKMIRYVRDNMQETSVADPGSGASLTPVTGWDGKHQDPESEMNIQDHFFKKLRNRCGSGIPRVVLTLDPGWKNSNQGSGINIPYPQHCKGNT